MTALPDGRKSSKISLAVQTQYRRHPAIQPSFDSKNRAYALRRGVKAFRPCVWHLNTDNGNAYISESAKSRS